MSITPGQSLVPSDGWAGQSGSQWIPQEINKTQPNENKPGNLFRACYIAKESQLSHVLIRDSKAVMEVGNFIVQKKKRIQVCSDWKFVNRQEQRWAN